MSGFLSVLLQPPKVGSLQKRHAIWPPEGNTTLVSLGSQWFNGHPRIPPSTAIKHRAVARLRRLARQDLLDDEQQYQLADTGQGHQRVWSPERRVASKRKRVMRSLDCGILKRGKGMYVFCLISFFWFSYIYI